MGKQSFMEALVTITYHTAWCAFTILSGLGLLLFVGGLFTLTVTFMFSGMTLWVCCIPFAKHVESYESAQAAKRIDEEVQRRREQKACRHKELVAQGICPSCGGVGGHSEEHPYSDDVDFYMSPVWVNCPRCLGTGKTAK